MVRTTISILIAWVLAGLSCPSLAAAQGAGAPAPQRSGDEGGFVLRGADGVSSLRLLGLLQPQFATQWSDGAPAGPALFVNRARLGVLGSVFSKDLQYMLVAEFGGGPRLLFLNVDYALVRDRLTVRVGQFRRPFSRSFLTFASQLSMIDRPMTVGPTVFGDNLDIGLMLHNGAAGRFEYAVGVFNGAGPNVVPDRVHPLIAARVGYNTGGLNAYSESDLEGGPARVGVAAAGIVDFDMDRDGDSFASGLVDLMIKAGGFSLSSAVYVGSRQHGPRWADQRLSAVGHHTQLGYVVARRFEPVVRYAVLLPRGAGSQHDVAGGLNVFFRGHRFKWQNVASVRIQPHDGRDGLDVRFQSQLTLAF